LSDWSAEARELDPLQIDWSAVSGRFPYKLRQRPGPQNALGRVKFMLPNRYNVYLHDTPAQELFRKTVRSFSSGCVRVAKPMVLADYLLSGVEGWDPQRIQKAINSGATTQVNLPLPIPVYFTYFTAWVDARGMVQFRDDIYGRDRALYTALIDQLVVETSGAGRAREP
jgi:murein L,D-transpeptidase YcbB/YkuD